ncbi:MBL fold metallo-hydrolase [Chrysiogenes arsenatis]|uniref:MBL fold metallo-hydrolase n=1 Tax=Chrysiogenes arsenatis TaxID=309797 RepID=UPI000428470F|nr:MBL fold metallo-hydrolase [Chrysiogenes arsenatis]
MRITVLASGSKGNAALVETDSTRVLIDAGLTMKGIEQRLESIGVAASSLNAVVLTHEHTDHVRGIGPLARRYRIPVYATEGTFSSAFGLTGDIPLAHVVHNDGSLGIGDIGVDLFSISHDAADPVGFRFTADGHSLCYVTDTGIYTSLIREYARDCHGIVIESNHDEEMLMEGKYPWALKQRVRSRFGHVSNREASLFLQEVWQPALRFVVLAHLSAENNSPAAAYTQNAQVLQHLGGHNTRLYATRQDAVGSTLWVS